jgi:hypothetical protein
MRLLNTLIRSVLPASIRRSIVRKARTTLGESLERGISAIPRYDLSAKHVSKCTVFATREELLRTLPKGGVVAEIGVANGDFSESILKYNLPKILYLVDAWDSDRYSLKMREAVEERFKEEIAAGTVVIRPGYSTKVGEMFDDALFDWIYIDTDHTYQTTRDELMLYSRKVKNGGVIVGHDYMLGNWSNLMPYGVISAVNEFCASRDWELVAITMEQTIAPSFAIRKMRG